MFEGKPLTSIQGVFAVVLSFILLGGAPGLSKDDTVQSAKTNTMESKATPAKKTTSEKNSVVEKKSASKYDTILDEKTAAGKPRFSESEKRVIAKDMEQATRRLYDEHYVHGLADYNKCQSIKIFGEAKPYIQKGQVALAIPLLTKAIAVCDTPQEKALYKTKDMANFNKSQILIARGICLTQEKRFTEAEKDLTEAIRLCPDFNLPYNFRAKVYTAAGKIGLAADDTAKASGLPSMPTFLYNSIAGKGKSASDEIFAKKVEESLAVRDAKFYVGGSNGRKNSTMEQLGIEASVLMGNEKYVQAIEKYTAAIIASADPKIKALYKSQDMYKFKLGLNYEHRAFCYLMLKNWPKAIADLTEELKLRPNHLESYINRGKAYKALGKTKEAEADLAMAKILKPNSLPKFLTAK